MMSDPGEYVVTRLAPREVETIALELPVDALGKLRAIAVERDMSLEALLRFYIGQGARRDISAGTSNLNPERTRGGRAD